MRLDRFSIILYIAFPVIGSICSIIMITQFVWLVQGSLENGLYPEVMVYVDMARNLTFFGNDHHTHRVLIPAVVGLLTNMFGITDFDSIALVFGTWNFAFFIFGIGVMLRIAIYEQGVNVFELILPTILVLFLPFFLSAVFYPILEAGIFLAFGLIFMALFYRNLPMLFVITIISAWVSEVTLLALFIIPALNYARKDNWWQAYLPFLLSGLLYVLVLISLSPDLSSHYLFNPNSWVTEINANFRQFDQYFFIQLLPAFALAVPFIAYRFYKGGSQRIVQSTLLLLSAYYIVFLLLSPEDTGRLMFMVMPLLVLFNFNDKTIAGLTNKFRNPD
ncbi:MAG: hypothetical protein WEB89_06610 [Balneolales bacterium]